jgi:hypothetical protein
VGSRKENEQRVFSFFLSPFFFWILCVRKEKVKLQPCILIWDGRRGNWTRPIGLVFACDVGVFNMINNGYRLFLCLCFSVIVHNHKPHRAGLRRLVFTIFIIIFKCYRPVIDARI